MLRAMSQTSDHIVSIIVPLYNQERYINQCIQSICAQTYKSLEIFIINDGSNDNSLSIAKLWAAKDDRIQVIDKRNEGTIRARMDGLKLATGDFISFVDSDDTLPENAISRLLDIAVKHDVDLVIGALIKTLGFLRKSKDDYNRLFSFPMNQPVRMPELFDKYYLGFFQNNIFPATMCARLYRKSVLDEAMSRTELHSDVVNLMGEDQYFNMQLFPYLKSMYRTDKVVYYYRYGGGTTKFNPNFPQLFEFSDVRLELLDQYNYASGYAPLYDEYVSCLYYHAEQLLKYNQVDRNGLKDFFKNELQSRATALRLTAFYKEHPTSRKEALLLMHHDYDGMCDYTERSMKKRYGSIRYRIKRLINVLFRQYVDLINKWSSPYRRQGY